MMSEMTEQVRYTINNDMINYDSLNKPELKYNNSFLTVDDGFNAYLYFKYKDLIKDQRIPDFIRRNLFSLKPIKKVIRWYYIYDEIAVKTIKNKTILLLDLLIKMGADVNAISEDSLDLYFDNSLSICLYVHLNRPILKVCSLLINAGINLNHILFNNETILSEAVKNHIKYRQLIIMLIEAGANVNYRTDNEYVGGNLLTTYLFWIEDYKYMDEKLFKIILNKSKFNINDKVCKNYTYKSLFTREFGLPKKYLDLIEFRE